MSKLPYLLLAWGLSLMIGCIICYQMGYHHGVKDTQAETQAIALKQTQQSIAKAKQDIAIIDNANQHYEDAVAKIRTQTQVVYKPVYEKQVCESAVFSQAVCLLLNEGINK